jgi:hypothetical protein
VNKRIKLKKGIFKKYKYWYCNMCSDFTKQIPIYKIGDHGEYVESYKCTVCGRKNYINKYSCPNCGAEPAEDSYYCNLGGCVKPSGDCKDCIHLIKESGTLIYITKPTFRYSVAVEYGSTPYDWIETHKCWHCKTIYEFENSNY